MSRAGTPQATFKSLQGRFGILMDRLKKTKDVDERMELLRLMTDVLERCDRQLDESEARALKKQRKISNLQR